MRTRTSDNPKHWYDRAAEMRLLAYDMKNEAAQRLMFKLADEYDRLGDRDTDRQVKHAKQSAPTDKAYITKGSYDAAGTFQNFSSRLTGGTKR